MVADFAEMNRYHEYERVAEKIREHDVALLILNAGWALMGNFLDLTPKEIEDTIHTEALHPVYMCKAMLPQLLSRPERSGILITSSGLARAPMPGFLVHSGAKSFATYLGVGLNTELKDRIDVIAYEAGQVRTKINLNDNKNDPFTVNPDVVTKPAIRDLGSRSLTYGCFVHDLQQNIFPAWAL